MGNVRQVRRDAEPEEFGRRRLDKLAIFDAVGDQHEGDLFAAANIDHQQPRWSTGPESL